MTLHNVLPIKESMKKIFCLLPVLVLAGCASMMPAPVAQIDALPIVKMGDTPPAGAEYVLHIPANAPIHLNLHARGSLLKEQESVLGNISFNQDVYVYKYWASYDRKTWKNSHTLLDVNFSGGMDVTGLNVNVGLDKN
jgi:uncharacterized protein YceK